MGSHHELGVERMLWGSDYPHLEGSWPHTATQLARTFEQVPKAEVAQIVGLNCAEVYGFDRARLEALAAEHGPALDQIGC